MHINSVEFAGAIGQIGQAAPASIAGLPQVAFSGRSNVGKSSLINRLLGRTRTPVARVSQHPGKTQEINFYRISTAGDEFCLGDLPGYGFAKAPKALRDRWRTLIGDFMTKSDELRGVVQLIDVRHGPTDDDIRAIGYLAELQIPLLFVLTKVDKLKPSQRSASIRGSLGGLGVGEEQTVAFSAITGEGRDDLLESVVALLGLPRAADS
jgi:GTP-binding protein